MNGGFRKLGFCVGALVAVSSTMAACGGDIVVGDVMGGAGGTPIEGTGGTPIEGSGGGSPDCEEFESAGYVDHQNWLATDNDFGELAGSVWVGGEVPGGIEIVISFVDGTLQVGGPAKTPVADEGYLDRYLVLQAGATFPLHGTTFDGEELLIPLPRFSPWEEWCALQTPVTRESDPCVFNVSYDSHCSDGECTANGQPVSQGWVESAQACSCIASECFARVEWPAWEAGDTYADFENYYSMPAFRLTYDAVADTLSGGYFVEGVPPGGNMAEFTRVP